MDENGGENAVVCGRNVSEILKYSYTYMAQSFENSSKDIQRPLEIVNATNLKKHNTNA